MACADAGLVRCCRDENDEGDPYHTYYDDHDNTIMLIDEAVEVNWRTLCWLLYDD